MPAYIIARVQVKDAVAYEEYKKLAASAIEEYGGRYLARGGRVVTLEGDEEKRRVVIVEFPRLERGEAFFRSPAYQKAIAARSGCAEGQFVLVEGVAP